MSARLKWTLAIVGLLATNLIAMVVLAVVAHRGGNQVIPSYYEKAASYDDEMARSAASQALGWRAEVAITGGKLDVRVSDADGKAVDGAKVRVTGYQRAHASELLDVAAAMVGTGLYRADVRERFGLHDLTVSAERGDQRYTQHLVVDAR